MQITTTMKYHFTPLRMAIIKKSTSNKAWKGVEKRETSFIVDGNISGYSHYGEQHGDSLKKQTTSNHTTILPNNSTTGYTPWGSHNWKICIYPNFHCSTVWINGWIGKEVVQTYNGIKSNIFESILMRWMNLEPII